MARILTKKQRKIVIQVVRLGYWPKRTKAILADKGIHLGEHSITEYRKKLGFKLHDPMHMAFRKLAGYARERARYKELPFDIDTIFIANLWKKQKGLDYYTQLPMQVGKKSSGPAPDSVSVDRVVPELGYTQGNTVLCRVDTNAAKNNASIEMLVAIVKGIRKHLKLGES